MKRHQYMLIAPIAGALILSACSSTQPPPQAAPPAAYTPAPPAAAANSSYLVTVTKNSPRLVTIGDQFTFALNVTAKGDVGSVTVADVVPEGASFVSAQPSVTPEGNKLTWNLGDMQQGETKEIKVTLKAEKEGDLAGCTTFSAVPRVCAVTTVGKPNLTIKMTGPERAMVGQQIAYNVVVQNKGTTIAKGVVVTDKVPEGLTSQNGQQELTLPLGDLVPGASKALTIPLKAAKRGKVVNMATASAPLAGKADAQAQTTIVLQGVKIEKTTKDDNLYVNRVATYAIVVSNPGDTDLSGVVVTDTAAPGTVVATAEGATVTGTTATWNVGELKAGEKKSFAVKVLSKVPGRFTSTASVSSAQGLSDSAQAVSEWKGVTGILLEMVDDTDPIQVGETSTFTIRVGNQGSSMAIKDLKIVATLPAELDAVASTVADGGVVSGKTITWPVVGNVAPKTSVVRTFSVKALKTGDARSKVSITTQQRKDPIEKEESTTVY
jgi:uncharacterized repeat protein (TIGR01451 family)